MKTLSGILLAQAETMGFVERIRMSLTDTFYEMWDGAIDLIPRITALLAVLIVGYILAKVLRWITRSALSRVPFDQTCDRIGLHEVTRSLGIAQPASQLMGRLIFLAVMLVTFVAAVDVLEMESVSRAIDSLMSYIPHVIGALVIVMFGLVFANFARSMVLAGGERLGFEYAGVVAQFVYGILVVVIGSLAVGQLQLNTALVDRVIEIGLMAAGAALALALGFGTRDMARHVVAGVYARESFPAGSTVKLGDNEGTIQAVRAVNTAIEISGGKTVLIPNGQLMETTVQQQT